MKLYSVDFRQKIIEVHEKENISIRKLAQRFGVAKSFIQNSDDVLTDFPRHQQWNQGGWKNTLNNLRLIIQPTMLLWLIPPG